MFGLMLLFVALVQLSPSVLPAPFVPLRIPLILGVLLGVGTVLNLGRTRLFSLLDPYLVFGIVMATGVSLALLGWLGGALSVTLDSMVSVLGFFYVAIACRSPRQLKILGVVLALIAFFVMANGLYAIFTNDVSSPYLIARYNTQNARIQGLGFLGDPNQTAQFFLVSGSLLWMRWKPRATFQNVVFTVVPSAVLAAGVFFTHSRGGVVALVLLLLFGFKDRLSLVGSSIIAGVVLAALLAFNVSGQRGMSQDDGDRLGSWYAGLQAVKAHPLFGVGMGHFAEYNPNNLTAHNSFLLTLAELGMVGYFFWITFIVANWTELARIQGISSSTSVIHPASSGAPELEPEAKTLAAAFNPWQRVVAAGVTVDPVNGLSVGPTWSEPALTAPIQQVAATPAGSDLARSANGQACSPVCAADDRLLELARMARALRCAFVAFFAAAFFLSLSFSALFYVLMGMAVALRLQLKAYTAWPDVPALIQVKRACVFIVASVLVLYLSVRFGPHT